MTSPQSMNELVVKSNHVIQASYRLTLSEQRLILLCVQQIKKGHKVTAGDGFSILAADFANLFGISSDRAYSELQSVADKLYERSVIIHQPDPDQPELEATRTRWVSAIDYIPKQGRVSIYFAAKMLPYISMLEGGFTRYNLEHISNMKSTYGIRFYELFKCWLFGASEGEKLVSLNELKKTLELTGNYSAIKDFKLKVLDKAMSDINTYSDLKASYKTKKTGRKITHIEFTFNIKIRGKKKRVPSQEVKKSSGTELEHLKWMAEKGGVPLKDLLKN